MPTPGLYRSATVIAITSGKGVCLWYSPANRSTQPGRRLCRAQYPASPIRERNSPSVHASRVEVERLSHQPNQEEANRRVFRLAEDHRRCCEKFVIGEVFKVDWVFSFACAAYNLVRRRNLSKICDPIRLTRGGRGFNVSTMCLLLHIRFTCTKTSPIGSTPPKCVVSVPNKVVNDKGRYHSQKVIEDLEDCPETGFEESFPDW